MFWPKKFRAEYYWFSNNTHWAFIMLSVYFYSYSFYFDYSVILLTCRCYCVSTVTAYEWCMRGGKKIKLKVLRFSKWLYKLLLLLISSPVIFELIYVFNGMISRRATRPIEVAPEEKAKIFIFHQKTESILVSKFLGSTIELKFPISLLWQSRRVRLLLKTANKERPSI